MMTYFAQPAAERAAVPRDLDVAGTLEAAHRALESGDVETARVFLRDVFERRFETNDRAVRALALQARVDAARGSEEAAKTAIDEARRALPGSSDRELATTHVSLALSWIYALQGRYAQALEAIRIPRATERGSSTALRDIARAHIAAAVLHQENGSPHEAIANLDSASELLSNLPVVPAAESSQIATLRAFCLGVDPRRLSDAHDAARDAVSTAAWHGLAFEGAWARVAQAWLYAAEGDVARGLSSARDAMTFAQGSAKGDQYARIALIAARLQSAAGHYDTALAEVDAAIQHSRHFPWLVGVASNTRSITLAKAGRKQAALAQATACIDTYGSMNESPYQGGARYARAFVDAGLARAQEDIQAAVHFFDRGGSVRDRIEAYALSARISGNSRHARYALELERSLLKT